MGVMDILAGTFFYENKKKQKFWLHMKEVRGVKLYYFSKDDAHPLSMPAGYMVVENRNTGVPFLKKVIRITKKK
jgi:hypothetical protein